MATAEKDQATPAPKTKEPTSVSTDIRLGKIAPSQIYGFPTDGSTVIQDHPAFPNPRSEMDQALIADIKEAQRIQEPLRIRKHIEEDGSTSYVLIDGKTRLTAVAEFMAENPGNTAFETLEFITVKGTDDDAFVLMGKLNLTDSRQPLNALDTARFLLLLDKRGIPEDVQAKMLNKENRGGIRWIREIKAVAESPELSSAVASGTIELSTAKQVAKENKTEAERKDKVEKVVEQKASGKKESEVRKDVTTRTGNRTTLGYAEVFDLLSDIYPEAKKAIKNLKSPAFSEEKIDWTDKNARAEYINAENLQAQFRCLCKFLKFTGNLYEVMEAIEANLPKDIKEQLVTWMPPNPKSKAQKNAE